MNFERGRDIKDVLDLGWKHVFEEIGGVIFRKEDLYSTPVQYSLELEKIGLGNLRAKGSMQLVYEASIVVIIMDNKFRIIKNRFSDDMGIYPIDHFPDYVMNVLKPLWEKRKNSSIPLPRALRGGSGWVSSM